MIKYKISYQDDYEKVKHTFKSSMESQTIDWILEKSCRLLVSLGFSLEIIQRYVKFDGSDVYSFEDWDEDEESDLK